MVNRSIIILILATSLNQLLINGQIDIQSSSLICSSNGQCANYNVTCNPGQDCVIQCGSSNSYNDQCNGAIINCPNYYNCNVHCGDGHQACYGLTINGNKANSLNVTTTITGNRQLHSSTINCPTDTTSSCDIYCNNMDNQCEGITINAEQSNTLKLTCMNTNVNGKNDICTNGIVRCPINNLNDGSCTIQGIFKTTQYTKNMQIYSKYGFSTVEILGPFTNIGTMHCNNGYTQSCTISNNNCVGYPTCDNLIIAKTDNPSKSPTQNPISTSSPTTNPIQQTFYSTEQIFVYSENFTVIINDSDINRFINISQTIIAIINPDKINLITTEIGSGTIKIFLSVETDTFIDGTIIVNGLRAIYGNDIDVDVILQWEGRVIEDIETTYIYEEKRENNPNGVNTGITVTVSIISVLFVICIVLIVYVYFKGIRSGLKNKEINNPETLRVASLSMQQIISVKETQKSNEIIISESPETGSVIHEFDTKGNVYEDMYNKPQLSVDTLGNDNGEDDDMYNDVKIGSQICLTPQTPEEPVLNVMDDNTLKGNDDDDDDDIYEPAAELVDENDLGIVRTPTSGESE
eukprot:222652_1